jgi:hypothetical protein
MFDFLRTRWTCALGAALLLGLAGAASAQTDVTTSRISGTVEDSAKAALPGVTVEVTNVETGLQKVTVTDADGFYRVLDLPTGTYKLTATLDGFATATAERVRLLIGSTPSVNFTLQSARVSETITVTAEASTVEVTNTQIGTTIQSEQIKNIPSPGNDYRNFVLLTPETRYDSERGNISISGQRGINTNVTIDGVDYNNAFFGGTTGAAEGRAPLSISQESIKEFSVITNGASVEFGRSGGGFVNIITKNGTNTLHGSGFYYNQPQSLISDFSDGSKPADQKKQQYGASLGGPLVKDKLFYFLSYDKQKQNITVPINGNILDPDIFARYPVLASPNSYVQTQDGYVGFGRVDYQVNEANRVLFRVNLGDYTGVNGTSSSPSRTESYNGVEGLKAKTYVASYSGQFGPNVLNDLNLTYVNEDIPRADKGLNLPEIQLASTGGRYGEVSFLPITSTNDRKGGNDTLSYLFGNHVVKGGIEYNDTTIDQVFRGNWRGVFVFNNKTDLLAGRWASYRQFGGLGGLTSSQAGNAAFGQKELALFVQDQWFVRPNLTVTFGLRNESQDNPNAPILNPNDRNANGSFNLSTKIPDTKTQLSPRFGLSWSPDEKSAVRFSAGRFWSRTPAILFASLFTSNGVRGTQYVINAPNNAGVVTGPPTDPLSPGWGANFTPIGVERIDFTRITTIAKPGVFTIDSNFKNPYTDRVTLGAEREIFSKTALALDFTYAKTKQLERLTDTNQAYDGTVSANGLPHYQNPSSGRPNPYYAQITTLVSDAESKYVGLTATLRRRYDNHFSVYGAVTYSKDKDNDSNERNFSGIQAEDFNNLDQSYGYSNRDQRWKGVLNSVWETPWWGIGLTGTFRYYTGSPYNATAGLDVNGDGQSGTDRPTVNGVHFDRNSFRQPDFYSLDMRLSKAFKIGPGDLSIFAECFNCTNASNSFVTQTVWGSATGTTPRTDFGTTKVSANGRTNYGLGTPRTVQLAARYDF